MRKLGCKIKNVCFEKKFQEAKKCQNTFFNSLLPKNFATFHTLHLTLPGDPINQRFGRFTLIDICPSAPYSHIVFVFQIFPCVHSQCGHFTPCSRAHHFEQQFPAILDYAKSSSQGRLSFRGSSRWVQKCAVFVN